MNEPSLSLSLFCSTNVPAPRTGVFLHFVHQLRQFPELTARGRLVIQSLLSSPAILPSRLVGLISPDSCSSAAAQTLPTLQLRAPFHVARHDAKVFLQSACYRKYSSLPLRLPINQSRFFHRTNGLSPTLPSNACWRASAPSRLPSGCDLCFHTFVPGDNLSWRKSH